MRAPLIFLLTLSFAFLYCCDTYDSEDLNQDKIKTVYRLTYDANTNETNAKAEFRFGNDYVEINPPASITFNSHDLEKRNAFGITWYRVLLEDSVSGSFEYTNQNGDTFTNFALIPPFIHVESANLFVSSNSTVTWMGPEIEIGETVTVSIRGENGSYSAITKEINTNSIMLRAGELKQDLAGNVTVTLTRSTEPDLNETTPIGGSLINEYISPKITTVVEE
ncbi:MAG: hypothetical protein WD022_06800 [Balneolaceae bacterium]